MALKSKNSDGLQRAATRAARTLSLDLMKGGAAALRKMRAPTCLPKIDFWHTRQNQQIDRREVGLRIGHLGLLGLSRR